MSPRRVALVGHCASGKSTVANLLASRGIEAYSVAQEHSIVHDLWRHQDPDILVFLDVSLDGVRRRKSNPEWPEWIFDVQTDRLAHAREHAELAVNTDTMSAAAIADTIQRLLEDR